MKILLIYPPVTIYGKGSVNPHIPMGLVYIAGYLRKMGHEVKLLDALADGKDEIKVIKNFTRIGLREAQIKKEIKKFQPEVVGLSVMFTAFADDAVRTAGVVKKVSKKIKTVVGGAHVSIDPKTMLKNKEIDFAIRGEGELAIADLVEALEKNQNYEKIRGLGFKKGRKIVVNPPTELIKNLDDLPLPAIDLLDLEKYQVKGNSFQMRNRLLPIITSRGCPNHCVYCSIHAVWEHKWRGRSTKSVVDEIETVMKQYGINEVSFQDDSMSVDKKRMNEICDEIIKRKLDIKWTTPNGIAHWTLDKNLLKKMKDAGCYRITFGIESGNPEMRRWVGKPFSLAQAKELTQYANKIGMWTLATNILGFPYETKENIQDTINYAIESDVDFALFFRLGPRPGTPIYEIFKKEGWLPKDEKVLFSEEVACDTKYIKGEELFEIQANAYRQFLKRRMWSFVNPMRILRKVRSVEDLRYVLRMGWSAVGMVGRIVTAKSGVTSKSYRV